MEIISEIEFDAEQANQKGRLEAGRFRESRCLEEKAESAAQEAQEAAQVQQVDVHQAEGADQARGEVDGVGEET